MVTMPFGRHKGQPLSLVPTNYLEWLLRTVKLSTGLTSAVRQELAARSVETALTAPPSPQPVICHQCGGEAMRYLWMQDRRGRRQIRRECGRCGQWLGFAPQLPPYTTEADAAAGQTPILDVLTRLDELGVVLESDGQRAEIPWRDRPHVPKDLQGLVKQCGHTLASMMGKVR